MRGSRHADGRTYRRRGAGGAGQGRTGYPDNPRRAGIAPGPSPSGWAATTLSLTTRTAKSSSPTGPPPTLHRTGRLISAGRRPAAARSDLRCLFPEPIASWGARPVFCRSRVARDEFIFGRAELEKAWTRAAGPSPQHTVEPRRHRADADELREIVDFAISKDLWLISDRNLRRRSRTTGSGSILRQSVGRSQGMHHSS